MKSVPKPYQQPATQMNILPKHYLGAITAVLSVCIILHQTVSVMYMFPVGYAFSNSCPCNSSEPCSCPPDIAFAATTNINTPSGTREPVLLRNPCFDMLTPYSLRHTYAIPTPLFMLYLRHTHAIVVFYTQKSAPPEWKDGPFQLAI